MTHASQAHSTKWYWAFFTSKMAMGASSALVPLFVIRVLGGGVAEVTIVAIAATVSTVPAYILWGAYVDRAQKARAPLLWGKAGETICYSAMAIAPTFWTFVAANLAAGFFVAATTPTSTILILEGTPKNQRARAIGYFTKVNGVGWVAGSLLGAVYFAFAPGLIGTGSAMRLLMGVCAVMFAASWAMSARWLHEPAFRFDHRWFQKEVLGMHTTFVERPRYLPSQFYSRPGKIRQARRSGPFWTGTLDLYLVASFLVFVGFLTFYTPFPVMLSKGIHLSDSEIFIVYLASSVMAAALYMWAGREVERIGNQRVQLGAWVLRIFIFLAFGLALLAADVGRNHLAFALAAGLNGLAGAMYALISVAGTTTVTRLAPENIHGEVIGAYNAVIGVGIVVGGVIGGVVAATYGWWAVLAVTGGFIALAAFLLATIEIRD
jgi:MFS family permease